MGKIEFFRSNIPWHPAIVLQIFFILDPEFRKYETKRSGSDPITYFGNMTACADPEKILSGGGGGGGGGAAAPSNQGFSYKFYHCKNPIFWKFEGCVLNPLSSPLDPPVAQSHQVST